MRWDGREPGRRSHSFFRLMRIAPPSPNLRGGDQHEVAYLGHRATGSGAGESSPGIKIREIHYRLLSELRG